MIDNQATDKVLNLNYFEGIQVAFQEVEEQRNRGDLLGAYKNCIEIVTHRLSGDLINADLVIIHCLADLAILFGQVEAADDLLTGVAGKYKEVGADQHADFAWIKRIHLALDRGLLEQADQLFQVMAPRIGDIRSIQFSQRGLVQWEARCVWHDADSQDRAVLLAQLHLAMGRLLAALGQYGDALTTLNQGLFHTGEETPSLARQTAIPLQLVMASAYLEKGDLALAQNTLLRLKLELDESQYPEYYIRWLELFGKLNLLGGEFGQALAQFQRIQDIAQKIGSHSATLRATLNLAHVLISLNQTSFARELLMDAQNQALATGDSALVKRTKLLLCLANARGQSLAMGNSVAQSVIGMRRLIQDDNLDEVDEEQEPISFITQSANYLTFFEDCVLNFHWQLSCFKLTEATNSLSHIQEAFQVSDSDLIKIKIKIVEAILAYYHSIENPEQSSSQQEGIRWAASILEEVRPSLRKMGLKPELWQVQRILGWCLSRLEHPVAQEEALAAETQALLDELTESLSPEDQAIYLLNKWTADEEYIASQINQLQRLQAKLTTGFPLWRPWRRWGLMQRLQGLLEHIDRYKDALVKRRIQGHRAEVNDAPTSALWRRLLIHPKNRVTLSFLVLPDRVLVIRSGKFLLDFSVIPITRLEVRNLVQRWHKTVQGVSRRRNLSAILEDDCEMKETSTSRELSAIPDEDEDFDELLMGSVADQGKTIANQLAQMLDFPSLLKSLPKNTRSLTLVPDDILHGFPFATIMHQGKYLIEQYALSIAYESSSLRATPPLTQAPKALLVGVSRGTRQFASLPAVDKELHQMKPWFTRHRIDLWTLKNNLAHKAVIIDGLLRATLLHIACHGTFKHNSPDQSGLVLIPNPEQIEILSLRELSNLNLTGLRHVTLSSCWSADHFILPGRWIISLPETLWRSGVQSILGCLWEVYEDVAVSFVTRFYDYLDELPRDEALRRTQLDCLEGRLPDCGNLDTANPLLWAGFNLYGDYRKLEIFLQR